MKIDKKWIIIILEILDLYTVGSIQLHGQKGSNNILYEKDDETKIEKEVY